MTLISISGTQEDILSELGFIFTLIGMCEGTCPLVATCRRSLDSGGFIDSAIQKQQPMASHGDTRVSEARFRRAAVEEYSAAEIRDEEAITERASIETTAVLLAAYRVHTGPGLKAM